MLANQQNQTQKGSLVVVGTGIKSIGHVTAETSGYIAQADRVLYAIPDWATQEWVRRQNPNSESFIDYVDDQPRKITYERWAKRILECIENGENVCAVFYGNPAVMTYASHEAIRRARERGYEAKMLASVSTDGVFFADTGIDPGVAGFQSYEATDFLIRPRQIDTSTGLLLWQAGVVGQLKSSEPETASTRFQVLTNALVNLFGPNHEVIVYEAAVMPFNDSRVTRMTLSQFAETGMSRIATLYLPPLRRAPLDLEVVDQLGIPRSKLDSLEIGPATTNSAIE